MADVKITQLPLSGTIVPASDALPIVNGGNTTQTTPAAITTAALNATAVTPAQGGTGATTLTGYVKGNGTSTMTAVAAIPTSDISGLNTMALQAASNVAITGGAINNTTIGATTRNTIAGTTELIGPAASANFTRFPNALAVVSTTTAGIQQNQSYNTGSVGEGVGNSSDTNIWGVGVYGAGYSNGNTKSVGVFGQGFPSASGDGGSVTGIRGSAVTTHSGGFNIGVYAEASGSSAANYALYMNSGNLFSGAAQSWTLSGALTFVGAHDIKIGGNFLPTTDNTQSLGSSLLRWNSIHIGPGSLFLQDTNNAGLNAELTVTDGVLLINGANQLQAPVVKATTVTGTTTSTAFSLGVSGDTGAINVYRDINIPTKNLSIGDLYIAGNGLPFISTNNDEPLNIQAESITINDSVTVGALTVSNTGVALSAAVNTGITVNDTVIRLFGAAVPAHSYGVAGDTLGQIAFDSNYMYYCTANYVNNSTNIWKRVAWSAGTW